MRPDSVAEGAVDPTGKHALAGYHATDREVCFSPRGERHTLGC